MPNRIQRKRTKGWEMPPGAVYVGRPGIWGNPFRHPNREYAIAAYRRYVACVTNDAVDFSWIAVNRKYISKRSELPVEVMIGETYAEGDNDGRRQPYLFRPFDGFEEPLTLVQIPDCRRRPLDDLLLRDLACWCSLDEPCHADVLLELANPPGVIHASSR